MTATADKLQLLLDATTTRESRRREIAQKINFLVNETDNVWEMIMSAVESRHISAQKQVLPVGGSKRSQ